MAAHRYWRLLCHKNGGPSGNGVFTVAELKGAIVAGGANVFTGGVASASSVANGAAANAFDGNVNTFWGGANPGLDGEWLQYDLGAGNDKDIIELKIAGRNDAFYAQAPNVWELQWSDTGLAGSWTTQMYRVTPMYSFAGEERTFSTAPTPTERVTEGDILVALNYPSAQTRVSQADVLTAYTGLAVDIRASQVQALVAETNNITLRVTDAAVLVAIKGRTQNPKVRAWTFSLDGHDYYVLRLGMDLTLVYDIYSEQWMDWDAFFELYWPVNHGINWVGGNGLAHNFGSNVLVGDDTYGLLWFLDPTQPYDQAPEAIDPVQQVYFPRIIQGQVPMVGREVLPCYAVWLTTDMGAPAYVGAGVKLEISDDAGKTYDDMGTVNVTTGVNDPELGWYSLGQIEAPGRLFRITDDGAVARIDNMEMNDPDDK